MKLLTKIVSLILIVAISTTAIACSSYGKVERAFINEGYEVVKLSDKAKEYDDEAKEYGVSTHYLEKKETLSTLGVVILEFNSTDDMKEYYDDNEIVREVLETITSNEDAKEFYDSLVDAGFANGNCLVLPATISAVLAIKSITKIVKNA